MTKNNFIDTVLAQLKALLKDHENINSYVILRQDTHPVIQYPAQFLRAVEANEQGFDELKQQLIDILSPLKNKELWFLLLSFSLYGKEGAKGLTIIARFNGSYSIRFVKDSSRAKDSRSATPQRLQA